jgi:hypothetical protein
MYEDSLPATSIDVLSSLSDQLRKFEFYLGGASGLALQLGHCRPEDLEFLTIRSFQPEMLSGYLWTRHKYEEIQVGPRALHCMLGPVKASFTYIPVHLLHPPAKFRGVDVADWRDILAEKFLTLSQRGSRRDFYDLYICFFIKKITIGEGVEMLLKRFAGTGLNHYHVLKSLGFFDDADFEPDPVLLKPVKWETVRSYFTQNLKEFEEHLLKEESLFGPTP